MRGHQSEIVPEGGGALVSRDCRGERTTWHWANEGRKGDLGWLGCPRGFSMALIYGGLFDKNADDEGLLHLIRFWLAVLSGAETTG